MKNEESPRFEKWNELLELYQLELYLKEENKQLRKIIAQSKKDKKFKETNGEKRNRQA